jgi:ubiquinone/menaquinone biosynthesis C-methylase UbiE
MTKTNDEQSLVRYDQSRAAGWMKWFHITEASAQPISQRMVELAGIGPGSRVLDLATGLGEPALTAAAAAAPNGHVLATDLSEDMIGFAANRADELALTNVEFRIMDANEPDVAQASFDAVLSRWGLMFLAQLHTTLAGVHRCLKPGGRFVAVVWGSPDGAPTNSLAERVLRKSLDLPPPQEGPLTPFSLQDSADLLQRTREAGFEQVCGEQMDVLIEFKSTAEFAAYRRDRAGSMHKHLAHLSPVEQDAAWNEVAEAAERFVDSDGVVRMHNGAFCMTAVR